MASKARRWRRPPDARGKDRHCVAVARKERAPGRRNERPRRQIRRSARRGRAQVRLAYPSAAASAALKVALGRITALTFSLSAL
jgi:hypothetical protein